MPISVILLKDSELTGALLLSYGLLYGKIQISTRQGKDARGAAAQDNARPLIVLCRWHLLVSGHSSQQNEYLCLSICI